MQTALIAGGGAGGVVAASLLKKSMQDKMRVVVLEKKDHFTYSQALPMVMVGEREAEEIVCDYGGLKENGVEVIQAEVTRVRPSRKLVETSEGDFEYDYLVVSLGAEFHPETVPGFARHALNPYALQDVMEIKKRIEAFNEGKIVVFVSSLPIKCPAAPYEISFLLDRFFREKNIRNKVDLTLVTPEPTPEALAPPPVGKSVRDELAERGIELFAEAKVLSLDSRGLVLDHGHRISARLFLGIPPHWGPKAVDGTDLVDAEGWIRVKLENLETRYPGVYAVGDNAAVRVPTVGVYAPKAAVFAHNQARVVAHNISRLARGYKPTMKYTGEGSCTMDVGYQKARHSNINYYQKPVPKVVLKKASKRAYLKKTSVEKKWFQDWMQVAANSKDKGGLLDLLQ